VNIIKVRDSFAKGQKGWKGPVTNRREGRGFWVNMPFLLPSSLPQSRGGAPGRRRRSLPAARGTAVAGTMGNREREACGANSPPRFQGRGPQGGGQPWRRAALAGVAAVLQSLATAGVRGKSTREPRGVGSPAHLG